VVYRIITPAALLLALASGTPLAQEAAPHRLWINAGAYSYHFDKNKPLRDNNIGLGGEYWLNPQNAAMAGSFINSNDARTRYAAWQWRAWSTMLGPVKVGASLALGAMDGYPRYHNGGWFPLVMPLVSFEYQRVGLNLYLTPKIADRVDAALSFQLKVAVW